MTETIRERARSAQAEEFLKNGGDEKLVKATSAIYEGIEALSPAQRQVMIETALTKAHEFALHSGHDGSMDPGHAQILAGLIAMAAYTNELMREDAGNTSTGDKAVDAVMDAYRDMLKNLAYEATGATDEQKAAIEELTAKVQAIHAETGEDIESILRREGEAYRDVLGKNPGDHEEAPAASGRYDDSGMYL